MGDGDHMERTTGTNTEHTTHHAPWATADDTALVAAFAAGEGEAFAEIVRRHRESLVWAARKYARNHHDVEDIVQDTLLRAALGLPRFRSQARLSTWLHRLACNAGYDFLNHRHMREIPTLDDTNSRVREPSWDPSESYTLRLTVEDALRHLHPEQAASLVLIDALGHTISTAARLQNVAVGTVKSRRHRAKEQLREVLASAT